MPDLIGLLKRFNRKERFFLITQALTCQLSDDFRLALGGTVDLQIPHDAFMAMDYHLDWLTAALYAHEHGKADLIYENPQQQIIKGNQEDIDLLVAFPEGEKYHIVLVEAKGATGWTNKQMQSKADRLTRFLVLKETAIPEWSRICVWCLHVPHSSWKPTNGLSG